MITVADVVADLREKGSSGFTKSYVSKQSEQPMSLVEKELGELVVDGSLAVQWAILSPEDGRIVKVLSDPSEAPEICELVEGNGCEPFEYMPSLLETQYIPV